MSQKLWDAARAARNRGAGWDEIGPLEADALHQQEAQAANAKRSREGLAASYARVHGHHQPSHMDGVRALQEMRERHRQNRLEAERQHEENQHRWYREIDCRRERSR